MKGTKTLCGEFCHYCQNFVVIVVFSHKIDELS